MSYEPCKLCGTTEAPSTITPEFKGMCAPCKEKFDALARPMFKNYAECWEDREVYVRKLRVAADDLAKSVRHDIFGPGFNSLVQAMEKTEPKIKAVEELAR